MIFVDSCIWIDFLKNKKYPQVLFLESCLSKSNPQICLSHIVYFEVLRGIKQELQRKRIEKLFRNFDFFDYKNEDFNKLISIYQLCIKKNFQLSKLGDWLILKTVLDYDLELLTFDKDFYNLYKIYPFKLALSN